MRLESCPPSPLACRWVRQHALFALVLQHCTRVRQRAKQWAPSLWACWSKPHAVSKGKGEQGILPDLAVCQPTASLFALCGFTPGQGCPARLSQRWVGRQAASLTASAILGHSVPEPDQATGIRGGCLPLTLLVASCYREGCCHRWICLDMLPHLETLPPSLLHQVPQILKPTLVQ